VTGIEFEIPFVPTTRIVEGVQFDILEEDADYIHQIIHGVMDGYGVRQKSRLIRGQCCYSLRYNGFIYMPPQAAYDIIKDHPSYFEIETDQYFPTEDDFYLPFDCFIDIVGFSGDLDYAMHLYMSHRAAMRELAEEERGDPNA